MKLSEKTYSSKTFITAIPSSKKEDFSLLLKKIKKLKTQPFHYVYLAMPSKDLINFKKQMDEFDLEVKQFEVKNGIARMEIV